MPGNEKPLIVQSDGSLLLDVHSPLFQEARARIALFSELEKSPEHIHTYRISSLSLWNAASAGIGRSPRCSSSSAEGDDQVRAAAPGAHAGPRAYGS